MIKLVDQLYSQYVVNLHFFLLKSSFIKIHETESLSIRFKKNNTLHYTRRYKLQCMTIFAVLINMNRINIIYP